MSKPNPYEDFNLLGESSPKDKWIFVLLVVLMVIIVGGVYCLNQTT